LIEREDVSKNRTVLGEFFEDIQEIRARGSVFLAVTQTLSGDG